MNIFTFFVKRNQNYCNLNWAWAGLREKSRSSNKYSGVPRVTCCVFWVATWVGSASSSTFIVVTSNLAPNSMRKRVHRLVKKYNNLPFHNSYSMLKKCQILKKKSAEETSKYVFLLNYNSIIICTLKKLYYMGFFY